MEINGNYCGFFFGNMAGHMIWVQGFGVLMVAGM